MYRQNGEGPNNTLFDIKPVEPEIASTEPTNKIQEKAQQPSVIVTAPSKTVEKIIVFYSDGTFEER